MSIVESARPSHSTRIARFQAIAGTALLSAAIFAPAPKVARGDLTYTGTGDGVGGNGQNWFNTANWWTGTTTGTLPEGYTLTTANVDAPNTVMPSVGVLFDPANQGLSATYVANLAVKLSSFYVSRASGSFDGSSGFSDKLTIESGTLITSTTSLGSDGPGIIVQKNGAWVGNGGLKIGGTNKSSMGSGTYEYHGGNFTMNNQTQVGSATQSAADPGSNSAAIGKFIIYNDGPDGALLVSNGFSVSTNKSNGGSIGIVEFHYSLDTHGVGLTRPIQNTAFNGSLSIVNQDFTNIGPGGIGFPMNGASSRLNLVLEAAPTIIGVAPQNLGLFKDANKIGGNGSWPKAFYTMDGGTGYSQGATISVAYSGTMYSWTISYSGLITFTNASTSAYVSSGITAPTNGNDVVLIGLGESLIPEPGSMALLAGAGSLILARRRGRGKKA